MREQTTEVVTGGENGGLIRACAIIMLNIVFIAIAFGVQYK